jgi:hypothetical protein
VKTEKKELDRQVAREAKAQAKIKAANARKANTIVKKAIKAIEKGYKGYKTISNYYIKSREHDIKQFKIKRSS